MSYLVDPLLLNGLSCSRPIQNGGTRLLQSIFSRDTWGHIILNWLLPLSVFLFIVIIIKLKWDQKRNKIQNLGF